MALFRECYKSSSSSSGADTTHGVTRGEHSKSHWGNTGHGSQHFHSLGLGHHTSRTPGQSLAALGSTNNASGYMGDKSSCPSQRKQPQQQMLPGGRPEPVPPRPSITEEEDQTGFFSDMMAEFKMNLQPAAEAAPHYLEATMQPSFMETNERDRDEEDYPMEEAAGGMGQLAPTPARSLGGAQTGGLDQTGAGGLNLTGAGHLRRLAPSLNMTGAGAPSLNMTGLMAAPGLNMTGAGAPSLNMTGLTAAPGLNMTGAGPAPSLNMTGATPRLMRTPAAAGPELNLTGATPSLNMTGQLRSVPSFGLNMTGGVVATTPGYGRQGADSLRVAAPPSLNLTAAPAPSLDLSDVGDQTDGGEHSVFSNPATVSPGLILPQDFDPFSQVWVPVAMHFKHSLLISILANFYNIRYL
jgi:hypothetical protein